MKPRVMTVEPDIVTWSESKEVTKSVFQERRGIKVSRSRTEYMCVNEEGPKWSRGQEGAESRVWKRGEEAHAAG